MDYDGAGEGCGHSTLPVRVLVLTSKDTEAVATPCVVESLAALNSGGRTTASTIDVHKLTTLDVATCDVLLISGGEPGKIRGLIGGPGSAAIKAFCMSGGGYVGVCAGAVLATRKRPTLELLLDVRCFNDNVWWASGISGEVKLKRPPHGASVVEDEAAKSLAIEFVPDAGEVWSHSYFNGPLLDVDKSRRRRPKKLTCKERDRPRQGTYVLAVFDGDLSQQLSSCGQFASEMDGKAALVVGQYGAGRVVISSTHPECGATSAKTAKGNLLEAMCLYAAGRMF